MIEAMAIANFMRRKSAHRVSRPWMDVEKEEEERRHLQRMGTISTTTSDEEETEDESDRAALLRNQINHDGTDLRTNP